MQRSDPSNVVASLFWTTLYTVQFTGPKPLCCPEPIVSAVFSANFSPNSGLGEICPQQIHRRQVPSDRRRFTTTLGDGGRGQVLTTVDRRSSPVDHAQRRALYTQPAEQRKIGRDVARRADLSVSAETC